MRRKYSFILTILPDDEIEGNLRGRIQSVSDRSTRTFKCADELQELLFEMVKSEKPSIRQVEEKLFPPLEKSS